MTRSCRVRFTTSATKSAFRCAVPLPKGSFIDPDWSSKKTMQVGFPRLISAAYAISALFPDFGGFHHHSVTMQEKASRSYRCAQGCAFLRTSDHGCDCDGEEKQPRIGMEKWRRFLFLVDFPLLLFWCHSHFWPRFWYGPVRPSGSVLQ